MSRYYPIALDIRARKCVVVGGGVVAERKALGLLECGAQVTVISPRASTALQGLAKEGQITLVKRGFRPGDLAGAFLVIGATDDPQVNDLVQQEARGKSLLVNIADDPQRCNFLVPASIRRGDLTIAVSTAGKSPALARQLRQELEELFPPESAGHLEEVARYRAHLRKRLADSGQREAVWRQVMARGLLELLREGRRGEADRLVEESVLAAKIEA